MNLIDDFLKATGNGYADNVISSVRAHVKSAAARAVKHVQGVAPPAPPRIRRAPIMEQNLHVTGTIDDRAVFDNIDTAFDGNVAKFDNTSTRSASSNIDRMSR